MYDNLKFRRQFLLTKVPITPPDDWKSLQIDEYFLYAHPDLEVDRVANKKKSIVLIGNLFDSDEPEQGNANILHDILANTSTIESIVIWLKRYAGSYALLYKDDKDAFIQHDPLALREIYYCTKDNKIACGSQPNLVAKFADPQIKPTSDPDLLDFYENHFKDSKWIGDETYYQGVKHLLPNHRLDINTRKVVRYWPNESIKHLHLDEAVSKSCAFLQGIMRAIVHRHSVMMAVTAGTDSRTLLAASRGVHDKIYYFVNNQGMSYNHPDITVPKKIFASIGVRFHVHDVPEEVDDEFRKMFLGNAFFATERTLPTIYNVYFKNHSEKVNILGIGEIGRTRFGKEPVNLNSYLMAYKLGYKDNCPYAIRQGEQILAELLPVGRKFSINILTLLYWEQMLGNWGVVGNSESDIAIEEVNPYNSHNLYEIFLGVDEKYTKYNQSPCVLFREMIRNMWPELLDQPINPPFTMRSKVAWLSGKLGVFGLMKKLKYQFNYLLHLYKVRIRLVL